MADFIERTVYTFECPRCGYIKAQRSFVRPLSCTSCGYPGATHRPWEHLKTEKRMDFNLDWLDLDRMYRR